MMTCREVSTTVAAGQVGRQSRSRRLQIWMHLLVCPHCRRFWQQVRAIDRGVTSWLRMVEDDAPADLARGVADRLTLDSDSASTAGPTTPTARDT